MRRHGDSEQNRPDRAILCDRVADGDHNMRSGWQLWGTTGLQRSACGAPGWHFAEGVTSAMRLLTPALSRERARRASYPVPSSPTPRDGTGRLAKGGRGGNEIRAARPPWIRHRRLECKKAPPCGARPWFDLLRQWSACRRAGAEGAALGFRDQPSSSSSSTGPLSDLSLANTASASSSSSLGSSWR